MTDASSAIAERRIVVVIAALDEAENIEEIYTRLRRALLALPAQVFLTGTEGDIFAPLRGTAEAFRATPAGLVPHPDFPVPNPA